ncbi:MAG: KUP/HAK/KT family potassium transporter [Azospirillaceae bacterium]|nr:KUP/HAK/KT family potassium transporter [Azospirillaceae bacterium]
MTNDSAERFDSAATIGAVEVEIPNERDGSWLLVLTALGIVFGDIGTSPIYALRVALQATGDAVPSPDDVIGVISLILWSLTLVISVKYVTFVMRADNRGEGGILALASLLNPWQSGSGRRAAVALLGLAGAALLVGDAVITPAVSVLSAVEGTEVVWSSLAPYVVPLTVVILIGLFAIQCRGTAQIGRLFGPVMVAWFVAIALSGLWGIAMAPRVLWALNPLAGLLYLISHGWIGFAVFGSVFLAITGGEALYADMGHVGRRSIKLAWFGPVFPALALNYLGQGGLLLNNPQKITAPFFELVPTALVLPLVILSTFATIIASQAVISGVFSLTRQAIQLQQWPRMRIMQTSADEYGQIYVPMVNWVLAVLTVALVLSFRTSDALAAAYGVAVSSTMLITALLLYWVMIRRWHWPVPGAVALCGVFVAIDGSFCVANLMKIPEGGWLPLVGGVALLVMMRIWDAGSKRLQRQLDARIESRENFIWRLALTQTVRTPGTVLVLTKTPKGIPAMLQHHIRHNRALAERVVLLTVVTDEVPRVPGRDRLTIVDEGDGFWRVTVRYGFMQAPDLPIAVRRCATEGLIIDTDTVTYYVGHETLVPPQGRLSWEGFYAFMSRNASKPTSFLKLPIDQVMEIGIQVAI